MGERRARGICWDGVTLVTRYFRCLRASLGTDHRPRVHHHLEKVTPFFSPLQRLGPISERSRAASTQKPECFAIMRQMLSGNNHQPLESEQSVGLRELKSALTNQSVGASRAKIVSKSGLRFVCSLMHLCSNICLASSYFFRFSAFAFRSTDDL